MNKITQKKAQQKQLATNQSITSYSDYDYIFASTLNQMVNYIPWKKFGFKNSKALTITDNKEFDNEKWNKHLQDVIGNFDKIKITQEKMLSIVDVKDALEKKIGTNKILWNITGGQRPFLFAVNQIIRPDDRLCYLEGNTQRLIILKPDGSIESTLDYTVDDEMTIEIALKLMGFDVKESEKRKKSFDDIKKDADKNIYLKLMQQICLNDELRILFVKSNKITDKKTKVKIDREAVKKEILTLLPKYNFTQDEIKKVSSLIDFSQETYPFGFILERMVGFTILDAVGNEIADMSMSESLYFTDKKQQKAGGGSSIDEFDIAILTKTGQLIIIECKSGEMSGDVAKSTKYSTYAAAGVYGKPILVTPLKKQEVKDLKQTTISDEVFNSIKSAIYSANRATLEVWGIDEITTKIEEKLML